MKYMEMPMKLLDIVMMKTLKGQLHESEVGSAITTPTDTSRDDHGIELTFTARQRSCGKVICSVVSVCQ